MADKVKALTPAEQVNKYELTSDQVLKVLGLDSKKYKAEKDYSSKAVKEWKNKKEYKNSQLYEWVIYEKVNGKWVKTKEDWLKKLQGKGLNSYATGTENGIIIIKPKDLAKAKGFKPAEVASQSVDVSGSNSDTPLGGDSMYGGGGGVDYDVVGYDPNKTDEKTMQHIAFIKIQLLKECYEGVGILL